MKKSITKIQALLTAVGFMIGSGIFFRADNIIISTNGNAFMPIFSWAFIGIMIIFAGMAVASLAARSNAQGGMVGYIEEHYGKKVAFIVGWYQVVLYVPVLLAVVMTVFVGYATQLFSIKLSVPNYYLACIAMVFIVWGWNALSTRIAAIISSTATVIKVIPLILIAVLGLTFGTPGDIANLQPTALPSQELGILALFMAPMLSMAFAFDGWVSVGSLSGDMKNPKKDLPFVFIWSVIITAIIYTTYYVGINSLIGPLEIIKEKDAHVGTVARELFGENGMRFVIVCVVISVLGTFNGAMMAGSRYIKKLADDNLLPGAGFMSKESKFGTPANAALVLVFFVVSYLGLYYMQAVYNEQGVKNFLTGITLDDIPIAINSGIYLFLFWSVFRLYQSKKGELSFLQGVIVPAIAAFGQMFIVVAFFANSSNIMIPTMYAAISAVIVFIGILVSGSRLKA